MNTAFPAIRHLVHLCGPVLLAVPVLAHAQAAPTIPVRVTVVDEKMKPVADAAIAASFEQTVVVSKLFTSERQKSTVAANCVTDTAGVCRLQAPLSFGSGRHNWATRAVVGTLDSVGGPQVPGLSFERSLAGAPRPDPEIGLVVHLGKEGARFGRYERIPSAPAIAAGLQKHPDSTADEMILSSLGARGLWDPDVDYDRGTHGYLATFTRLKTGEVVYELRARIVSQKSQDLFGGNKRKPVPPAEARVKGETWTLPGIRLSQEPLTRPLRPLFGSPKDLDAEEDIGTREVFAYPLTRAQVDAIMADYVEGSDAEFTFNTGKDNGEHVVSIPLVEMRALLMRREELAGTSQ